MSKPIKDITASVRARLAIIAKKEQRSRDKKRCRLSRNKGKNQLFFR